jgi:hypothetical protein
MFQIMKTSGEVISRVSYLIGRARKRNSLMVKLLNIVKLHDILIVFSPPSLCLPFVEHLTAIRYQFMHKGT